MEQDVAERPFSQEQRSSLLQSWHNGTVNGRGTHQNNGQLALCRDHLRGRCTRGTFCKYKHSGVVDQQSDQSNLGHAADPINSRLLSDNKDGDSSRSFIGESRSRSPCRKFQSGRCFRGSSCPYLHPQFANFSETSVDDSSRKSFFGERRERSPCRNFQSGRCNRGSTCPYLHPDFSESKGLMHDLNVVTHHGVLTASNNSRFHERNVGNNLQTSQEHHEVVTASRNLTFHERYMDNNLLTSDEHHGVVATSRNSRFHGGNMVYNLPSSQVLNAANSENNSRISFSREPQNRSPCRFFLQGRCNLGASCRYWHPVNAQPRIPEISHNHGFADGANQHINLKTGPYSGEPINRSTCHYIHRGICYQGEPSSDFHPVTHYERRKYDLGAQHHQGVLSTTRDLSFDRENVVREVNHNGERPYQDTHTGCNVSLNDIGINTNHGREYVGSRSWSSERKKSRLESDFRGNRGQPEFCLNFTKGRCDQGSNCRYLHSFHEYASSITQPSQKPRAETNEDSIECGEKNQTMLILTHDTRDDRKQPKNCTHTESSHVFANNSFDNESQGQSGNYAGSLNIVNQNGDILATDGGRSRNSADGNENVNLWSPPFKRQRTWSRSSFSTVNNNHCRTLRPEYSLGNNHSSRCHIDPQNRPPYLCSFNCNGPANRMNNVQRATVIATSVNPSLHVNTDSTVIAPSAHGDVVSHEMQLDQCRSGIPCPETGLLSKNEIKIYEEATPINQETVDPDSTSSLEKHHIYEANKTTVALKKLERIGVNVDMNHELNEKTGEAEHLVKTYSMKKSFKQNSSSFAESDSLNQMNVAPVSGVSADCIGTSVPETNDIGILLANNLQQQGNEIQSINFQKTGMQSSSATTGDGNLHGDTDNSALPESQPSDITIPRSRRKLLILDVNGLLVDIVVDFPDRFKPDAIVGGKGVFKRPFFDDFLRFCFEKFDVGIWTSRTIKNLTRVLDCLMENTKDKLLFCWHQSHCTQTGYRTVENNAKPLILKELKKLWENIENDLPWKKGFYDETNTILLDDSPYKALRNPPYTAVFPYPYSFKCIEDKSLGPDGDLRLYLERLSEAENVQKFIQENRFGQRPITKNNPSWTFYSKIVEEYVSQLEGFSSKTFDS